jgi:hypothetical protein
MVEVVEAYSPPQAGLYFVGCACGRRYLARRYVRYVAGV